MKQQEWVLVYFFGSDIANLTHSSISDLSIGRRKKRETLRDTVGYGYDTRICVVCLLGFSSENTEPYKAEIMMIGQMTATCCAGFPPFAPL
jgi:hypothetical protein